MILFMPTHFIISDQSFQRYKLPQFQLIAYKIVIYRSASHRPKF